MYWDLDFTLVQLRQSFVAAQIGKSLAKCVKFLGIRSLINTKSDAYTSINFSNNFEDSTTIDHKGWCAKKSSHLSEAPQCDPCWWCSLLWTKLMLLFKVCTLPWPPQCSLARTTGRGGNNKAWKAIAMLLAATGSYYPLMKFRVPPKGKPYKDLPDHSAGSKWLPPLVSLNPKSGPRSKLSDSSKDW